MDNLYPEQQTPEPEEHLASISHARRIYLVLKRVIFAVRRPSRRSRFEAIARRNDWRNSESLSGFGSTIEATESLRLQLPELLHSLSVETLLDIPCGDFNWMRLVNHVGQYTGADIVGELIEKLALEYSNDPSRHFAVLDLVTSQLPKSDLVFVRECFNHFSLAMIQRAVSNIGASQSKWILVTHYPNHNKNRNQETGFIYRPLNFTLDPFNWPNPSVLLSESVQDGRVMALWRVSDVVG